MPCAIHDQPRPCRDCEALIRATAVWQSIQASTAAVNSPNLPATGNAVRPTNPVRRSAVQQVAVNMQIAKPQPVEGPWRPPANTNLVTINGKNFLKCSNLVVGCAGPNPGEWLNRGYETCPECRSAAQPQALQHSLVPVAWAIALRTLLGQLGEKLDANFNLKNPQDNLEDFIYDAIRDKGEVEDGYSEKQFRAWYLSICVQGQQPPQPQYSAAIWQKAITEKRRMKGDEVARVAQDFFLCFPRQGSDTAQARIYLNLDTAQAPKVFQWIVTQIIAAANNPYRAHSVKIAGPAVKRSDTIVLYLVGKGTAQQVVDALGVAIAAAQIPKSAFLQPMAAFTNPAQYDGKTLGGISTGPEPPLDDDGEPSISLGRLTAKCILGALEKMAGELNAGRKFQNGPLHFFLTTTWTYMRQCGLDHVTPAFVTPR